MSNDKQTTAKEIQDVIDPDGEMDTSDNFYKMLADNHNEFLANSKESRAKFVDALMAKPESAKSYCDAFVVDSSGVLIALTIQRIADESDDSLFDRVSDITADYWVSPNQLRGASHE